MPRFTLDKPFAESLQKVTKTFVTNPLKGLSEKERSSRLNSFGANTLPEEKPPSVLAQIIEQLKNPIVLLLFGTATVAAFTGELFDAGLIYGIVLVMAGIGVWLEKQSEKSLAQLKSLQSPTAIILINGKPLEVAAESVVPGDIVVLHDGDVVPADLRLCAVQNLKIDEASLTGESLPVTKFTKTLAVKTQLAERKNMAFAGTAVVEGSGTGVVVATGTQTEVGKIATFLNTAEKNQTPLEIELEKVGQFLLYATLISVAIILSIYLLRGQPLIESLLTTSSLAIAFVPEGLSAVLTITLALAVSEMVKKKVIVKRLLAAEGLGSVTHIATDKTGTITEGKMTVAKIYINGQLYDVKESAWKNQRGYSALMDVVRFCNNNKGPTEQALLSFLRNHDLEFELSGRVFEHPFTSELKRMSIVYKTSDETKLLSKGAPEVLIPLCSYDLNHSENIFTETEKQGALEAAEKLAGQGFRVLALADSKHSGKTNQSARLDDENKLCFLGLVALIDPLRDTVKDTVTGLREAGITPLMITGDHPAIAKYIAEQAGIIQKGEKKGSLVLTGQDLDVLLPKSLMEEGRAPLLAGRVFARVKPEHKLLLVEFYQQQGYRVAMTGDGVNDAAAIKKADIGIAMSNGVGLTRDIADVIITGTYDALLRAVSIGRTVKLRTQLYLHYLLSGNSCQVGIFFVAVAANLPIPLTSVMLLLINLCTDALPAIAMAVEPEDPEVVKQKVSLEKKGILSPELLQGVAIQGLISTLLLSAVYFYFLPQGNEIARTAVFSFYLFQKGLRGFTARSFTKSVFEYGFFSNKLMNIALLLVLIAWVGITQISPYLFGLTHLHIFENAALALLALVLPLTEEITKLLRQKSSIEATISSK